MRKLWPLLLVTITLFSVLFAGCAQVGQTPAAVLMLRFRCDENVSKRLGGPDTASKSASARTIAPTEAWASVRYVVSGTGPGGANYSKETTSESTEARLAPGEWVFSIVALSASGKTVAEATGTAVLSAGRESTLSLSLLPLQGQGSLDLVFHLDLPVTEGARISGTLISEGFPGKDPADPVQTYPFDIPANTASYSFPALPAGFYTLSLSLDDGAGIVAGLAESVLVLKDFQSTGECRLSIGTPSFVLTLDTLPVECIESILPQAWYRVSREHPFSLAAVLADASAPARWSINGEIIGQARRASADVQAPKDSLLYSDPLNPGAFPLTCRADILVGPDSTGAYGSETALFEFAEGPSGTDWSWRAGLDARSAQGPSLFAAAAADNTGTGTAYQIKATAATNDGLVAIAGFDEDCAIHLFLMTGRSEYESGSGPAVAASGSGLIRLWRNEITINSSQRNPDRLAFSEDGHMLAAASSASSWLRLYDLDDTGEIARTRDIVKTANAADPLSNFDSIRGLSFSGDGSRLYALANSPESVFIFDTQASGAGFIVLLNRVDLGYLRQSSSVNASMQDIAVASDGMVVVSAAAAGKITAFSPTVNSLQENGSFTKNSESWTEPGSLVFSADGLCLYALCDTSTVYRYVRSTLTSPLYSGGSIQIPESVLPAKGMAAGVARGTAQDSPHLGIFGSGGIAITELSPVTGLALSNDVLIPAPGDGSGADCATDAAFMSGCFVTAGGSSGVLSVYGND